MPKLILINMIYGNDFIEAEQNSGCRDTAAEPILHPRLKGACVCVHGLRGFRTGASKGEKFRIQAGFLR